MGHSISVQRMPLGDGSGGGPGSGGSGGTGAPIGGTPGLGSPVVPSQKLPNAVAASAPTAAIGLAPADAKPKIQAFSQAIGSGKRHTESWKRKTNINGTGATHVKSFHCKLNSESVEYMDQQINQWLDDHPDYEVKFVTTSIGEWTGKVKEPAMVVCVWV